LRRPFNADLEVDEAALRREIDYVVRDCGATMVVAAGVETQEYTYLSPEQRKGLIRRTTERQLFQGCREQRTENCMLLG
jgi:4-hydroxy-tetrahydrodipicolinate synthase